MSERTPTVTLEAWAVPELRALPRESSNVEAWAYVPGEGTEPAYLFVRFKSGGLYRYAGVPPILWESLQVAPSIGTMLHAKVVGNPDYPCERVQIAA